MIESSRPNFRTWIVGASLFAILLPTVVVAAALVYRSTLAYQINYNEGWNAYFIERVRLGLALYPSPQAGIINNYPPLSFYLVAALSALVGKIWIAGRLVAWFSFVACAALIWAILRIMKCSALAAAFGTGLFAAIMVTRYDLYIGMFDPQMTANALMLGGLLVLLRGEASLEARNRGGGGAHRDRRLRQAQPSGAAACRDIVARVVPPEPAGGLAHRRRRERRHRHGRDLSCLWT